MTRYLSYAAIAALLLVATAVRSDGPAEANGAPNFLKPAGSSPVIDTGRVIVQFAQGATPAERANLHAARGGRVVDTIDGLSMEVVELRHSVATRAAAAAYALSPLVVFAQPDALMPLADDGVIPNDEFYPFQWQHENIDSPEAWAHATGNSDLLVTICDTGVSASHPDLAANLRGDLGRNTASGNTDWSPIHYHGTAVAGAAAAAGNNTIGVSGVAQVAGIVPVRVSNRTDGAAELSDIAQCIEYGADIGSTAINLSYTTYTDGAIDPVILAAADYANARGSVLVVAAGNSNRDDAAPDQDPENILYVAATTQGNAKASFSNFGESIDVAAPGESVVTTYTELVCRGKKCRVAADDYTFVSGTSFAAPIVAGAVVVAADAHSATLAAVGDQARAGQLRALITGTACDAGVVGEDIFYGAGILNLHSAVHGVACLNPIPAPTLTSVVVLPSLASVYIHDTIQFEAFALWSDGGLTTTEGATWASANDAVATVNTTGLATGVSVGTFIAISATYGEVTGNAFLSVSEPPEAGTQSTVDAISYKTSGGRNQSKNLEITISVVDNVVPPNDVEGASVDIWLTNGLQLWSGTGTTGSDGDVTFTLSNAPSGTYTTIVLGVTAAGLDWDGATPPNSHTK
jgi:hypothetical protein